MTNLEQLENLCRMLDDAKSLEDTLTNKITKYLDLDEALSFIRERTLILEALTGLEDENGI